MCGVCACVVCVYIDGTVCMHMCGVCMYIVLLLVGLCAELPCKQIMLVSLHRSYVGVNLRLVGMQ